VVAAARVRAFGAGSGMLAGSSRTYRGALAAAALAFTTVVFGALTANAGFGTYILFSHRLLAILLGLHLTGLAIGIRRRKESQPVAMASGIAVGLVIFQIILGMTLLALHLPPVLQSIHQASGTLLWVAACVLAVLAKEAAEPRVIATERRAEPVPVG